MEFPIVSHISSILPFITCYSSAIIFARLQEEEELTAWIHPPCFTGRDYDLGICSAPSTYSHGMGQPRPDRSESAKQSSHGCPGKAGTRRSEFVWLSRAVLYFCVKEVGTAARVFSSKVSDL